MKRKIKFIIYSYYIYIFKKKKTFVKERLNICKGCEFNKNGICSKCSCVICVKVCNELSSCPLQKWNQIFSNDDIINAFFNNSK